MEVVLKISRQDRNGALRYYATTCLPLTGRVQYLQADGTLRMTCADGWFDDLSDLGAALQRTHVIH